MNNATAMFAWNRPVPGREQMSAAHFDEFVSYLGALQKDGQIDSFEPVQLEVNASGMQGFFLIRADSVRIGQLLSSDAWTGHMLRAMFHLDRPVLMRGVTGAQVHELMGKWRAIIPA